MHVCTKLVKNFNRCSNKNMSDINFYKEILDKIGFPILVAGYLLLRTDKRIERITELQSEILAHLKAKKDE